MIAVTAKLAQFVASLRGESLPRETVDWSKLLLLDLLGNMLAGSTEPSARPLREVVMKLAGRGSSSVVGQTRRIAPAHAALLNGTFAQTLDFDDTHPQGSLHAGAVVIPAALAVAEQRSADGLAIISAIVAGYEVACRLAMALDPQRQNHLGFHSTGIVGPFAAAAGVGLLYRMSPAELANVFGISLSQSGGTLQFLANGSWTKRLHAGLAGHNGILAAELGSHGFIGVDLPLEGERGLLRLYTDQPHPELIIGRLGDSFEITRSEVKPFPTGRYSHAPLDAVINLVTEHDIHPHEVEGVTVGVSQTAADIMGLPLETKRNPQNTVEAQFSIPYQIAVAIARRAFRQEHYGILGDSAVRALMQRVDVVVDADATSAFPNTWQATVRLRARGHDYSKVNHECRKIDTWEEVEAKFHSLASGCLSNRARLDLISLVRDLEHLADSTSLWRCIARPSKRGTN